MVPGRRVFVVLFYVAVGALYERSSRRGCG